MKSKFIKTIILKDPDSNKDVYIEIMKLVTGEMIGLDYNSFEKTNGEFYNPYNKDSKIDGIDPFYPYNEEVRID